MATTDRVASYHKPLVSKYARYVYPHFTDEQLKAIEELAESGGVELCVLHELALAKHLNLRRESVDGYDLCCDDSGRKIEAKYKRLVENGAKDREDYLMKLGTKELQAKTADYLWITVYNQFNDSEDHFLVPRAKITGKSFNFTYNRDKDSYNQGDKFLVRRGFLTDDVYTGNA